MSDPRTMPEPEEEPIDERDDEATAGEELDAEPSDGEQDLDTEGDEGGGAGDGQEGDATGADDGEGPRRAPVQEREVGRRRDAGEEIRRLRARAQQAERERDEERARNTRPAEPPPRRETPEERQQRLALMDPDQRTQYLLDEQRQQSESRLAAIERHTLDTTDALKFDNLCARKPHMERLRDEVEREYQGLAKQGRFVPRESLAYWILGKQMDGRLAKAKGQQVRRGRERVEAERTRPTGGRGDVATPRQARGNTRAALEARLKDQEI